MGTGVWSQNLCFRGKHSAVGHLLKPWGVLLACLFWFVVFFKEVFTLTQAGLLLAMQLGDRLDSS